MNFGQITEASTEIALTTFFICGTLAMIGTTMCYMKELHKEMTKIESK